MVVVLVAMDLMKSLPIRGLLLVLMLLSFAECGRCRLPAQWSLSHPVVAVTVGIAIVIHPLTFASQLLP